MSAASDVFEAVGVPDEITTAEADVIGFEVLLSASGRVGVTDSAFGVGVAFISVAEGVKVSFSTGGDVKSRVV